MIKELVMVHDGVCCLSSDAFVTDDVCALISYLALESFFILIFILFLTRYVLCVYCAMFLIVINTF